MSTTINGVRTADLPNLGAVTDGSVVVGDHAGTGSFAATALRDYIAGYVNVGREKSVLAYGAVGDGGHDDTVAIQAALDHVGSGTAIHGGTVTLPSNYSFKAGTLTLPPGVSLKGPLGVAGAPGLGNFSPPYGTESSLELLPGATINASGGNCIEGLLIIPSGMVFPQNAAGAPATWTGTAINLIGDDVTIRGCMIMGFQRAVFGQGPVHPADPNGCGRVRIRDCNIDCVTGIQIVSSADIMYIDSVHCWPFATISQAGTGDLTRSGVAFYFQSCISDFKMSNCFAFGYYQGYRLTTCVATLIGCSADHINDGTGQGFSIDGNTYATTLEGCLASGSNVGFYINSTQANEHIFLANCRSFGHATDAILIDINDTTNVTIWGGYCSSGNNGIVIATAVPAVRILGVAFYSLNNLVVSSASGTPSNVIFEQCSTGLAAGGVALSTNLKVPRINSAAPLALGPNSSVFMVDGTTNFSDITGGWAGRQVTLVFTSAGCAIASGTTTATQIKLNNNATFTAGAGSTLTIRHTGYQWYEVGRCQ